MLKKPQITKHSGKLQNPCFPTKGQVKMIEGDKIIQEDSEVANIMNDFFGNAVASLNIVIPSEYITDEAMGIDDNIEKIISKYSNHPSIKLIKGNVLKGSFKFKAVNIVDIEKEVMPHSNKSMSMSGSIPPKILKENSDICCKPFVLCIFCPGTMTTHAESIDSDLQRGLNRRLRHTQH